MHTHEPARGADEHASAGWLLVATQAVLLAAAALLRPGRTWPRSAWLATASTVGQVAGLSIAGAAALSLRRGLTALPYPNAHAQLRTGGLFSAVRHPIYAGLLLAVGSRAAGSGRPAQLGVTAALLGVFEVKTRIEEDALRERFTDYGNYAATTGRLLPRLRQR